MDDYKLALPALRRAEFMFGFDLEKGYYHLNLAPEACKFFGFHLWVDGEEYLGYYTICPFGLSTIPHFFTSVMHPWVKLWRSMGI